MTTHMPTSVDLRIWMLSRTMGWSGRRVASEVGVSQPTVVRTLERLSKEPPTEQDISDFVNVTATAATPPRGLPAIPSKIRSRQRQIQHNGWLIQVVAVMMALAVIAVLAGITVKLLTPAAVQPGQIACLRYAADGSIARFSSLSHGGCPRGEYAVTIVQNS